MLGDILCNIFFPETTLQNNNLLTVIPLISTEWSLTFNLLIFEISTGFGNIIHFTIGDNGNAIGTRNPMIFAEPHKAALQFKSSANGQIQMPLNNPNPYPIDLKKKLHIEVHQRYLQGGKYRLYAVIDGKEIKSYENADARMFHNMKVYVGGDPWYPAAKANISDLEFTNFL